jgi:TrmH family RNA methyltransferase
MIGNEGHGIPKEISAICDGSVYIPISEKTESLNASVAAAIFMWEQGK